MSFATNLRLFLIVELLRTLEHCENLAYDFHNHDIRQQFSSPYSLMYIVLLVWATTGCVCEVVSGMGGTI